MRNRLSVSIASVLLGAALLAPQAARAGGKHPAADVPTQNGKVVGDMQMMGKTKSSERWAAAARKADRHAEHLRKHGKRK